MVSCMTTDQLSQETYRRWLESYARLRRSHVDDSQVQALVAKSKAAIARSRNLLARLESDDSHACPKEIG